MTQKIIKAGIVGGTGYTGVELLRLLAQHPHCELRAITSRKEAGMPVAEMFPNLRGRVSLRFSEPAAAGLNQRQESQLDCRRITARIGNHPRFFDFGAVD